MAAFPPRASPSSTNADGVACVSGLLVSQFAGSYTVTESVPAGYVADGDLSQTVSVSESTCAATPSEVTFANTPLTDVDVSVDSQVDGGTASTISCVDSGGGVVGEDLTNAPGDVSVGVDDLEPGTYTCTVVIDP